MRGPVTPSKMFARPNTFTFKSNQLFHRRSQIVEEVSENSRCPDQSGKGVTLCSRHLSDNEPQMQLRMQYCRSSLISQLMWVLWCNIVYASIASVSVLSAKDCNSTAASVCLLGCRDGCPVTTTYSHTLTFSQQGGMICSFFSITFMYIVQVLVSNVTGSIALRFAYKDYTNLCLGDHRPPQATP